MKHLIKLFVLIFLMIPASAQEVLRVHNSNQEVFSFKKVPMFRLSKTNGTSRRLRACGKNNSRRIAVNRPNMKIEIYPISETLNGDPVSKSTLEQIFFLPDNCLYTLSINPRSLKKKVTYAWRIVDLKRKKPTIWRHIIVLNHVIPFTASPYICEKNHIRDPSFQDKRGWYVGNISTNNFSPYTNQQTTGAGDSGSVLLTNNSNTALQGMLSPTVAGKKYKLKFFFKVTSGMTKIKALAFNGSSINQGNPNQSIAVIGQTGHLLPYPQWQSIEMEIWNSHVSFKNIALVAEGATDQKFSVLIDRVCFVESNNSGCSTTPMTPHDTFGFSADYDLGEPDVTDTTYLEGTVTDLYPNIDTSTVNWYESLNDPTTPAGSASPCSIDNETPDETAEDEDMLLDFEQEEEESDLSTEETEDFLKDGELSQPHIIPFVQSGLTPIAPIKNQKCSKPILDPTKPFSGRDIVYIHGLQVASLKGNIEIPPTFQGRWPGDKNDFYKTASGNGEVYVEAEHYWQNHIQKMLGSTTNPSNSYLMANWSSSQRLEYGIHAVLTQIRDALSGENQGVTFSVSSRKHKQCFGDNGIVVITHSTGGLLASAMFGVAEASVSNSLINSRFGDVRKIVSKIDAQLGINSAYRGSKFAKIMLYALTEFSALPTLTKRVLGRAIGESWDRQIPNQISNLSNWWNSVLVDLSPEGVEKFWKHFMVNSTIPTVVTIGSLAGTSMDEGQSGGFSKISKLVPGFDDGVLSQTTQGAHLISRPIFLAQNKRFMKDKAVKRHKRLKMVADARKKNGRYNDKRNFYVTPYLSPSGMLQNQSVKSLVAPTNLRLANHYSLIQSTADHLDGVDEINRNGHHYGHTGSLIDNNEESSAVMDNSVYTLGLVHPDFKSLSKQWVKKQTWGFHVPYIEFKWPIGFSFHWSYKEFIKWKRYYHYLQDYKQRVAVEYAYRFVLR